MEETVQPPACDGTISEAPLLGGCFQDALFHTAPGLQAQHQNLHQVLILGTQLPVQYHEGTTSPESHGRLYAAL